MTLNAVRRRSTRGWPNAVVLLAIVALLATACQTETPQEPEEPADDGQDTEIDDTDSEGVEELTFAVTADEGNLTPWNQDTGYPGYYMMTLMYDTLFWLDEDLEPQPWLVDDWEVSDDGLTWELSLRDDVTFHDGEPLTSEDVAFTIDYLSEHPRPRFTPTFEPIESVDTPDEHTVIFNLSEPRASFILRPLSDLPILPEHEWADVDDPTEVVEETPVGSGPYELTEFVPSELWRFEANDDYFMGAPTVDEILMPYIAEDTSAFLEVRTGGADAVSTPLSPELVEEFEAEEGVELIEGEGFRGFYLIMNCEREPFDQPEFRRAVMLALDIDDLVETVTLGTGTPGSPGFVHREAPWANPDTVDHERDVDAAGELLDELGYEAGADGTREGPDGPLEFDLLVPADDSERVRAAELISGWLAEVGIVLNVEALDAESAQERMWPDEPRGEFQGDYFIGVHSWAGVIHFDPDFLTGLFHSDPDLGGLSRTGYANQEFDELTAEQERTVDPDEREEILHQMQELLAEGPPAVPLYFPAEIVPYRPETYDGWIPYAEGILNKGSFLPQ